MSKLAVFGVGAALLLAAAPASAITTFAGFLPASNVSNISYTGALDGSGTLSSVDQMVNFTFLNPDGSVSGTTISAMLNLSATVGVGTLSSDGSFATLPISNGLLTLTTAAPVTWNGHTGTNLLSATFSGSQLTALMAGSVANYSTSNPPATVNFTSDFLDFSTSTSRDLSLAIDAINPSVGFAFGGVGRNNFGTVGGLFGADATSGNPQGVVPEPATWALMFGGFGLVGSVLRSQRRRTEVTFG